jgi:hypothetical protein
MGDSLGVDSWGICCRKWGCYRVSGLFCTSINVYKFEVQNIMIQEMIVLNGEVRSSNFGGGRGSILLFTVPNIFLPVSRLEQLLFSKTLNELLGN